MVNLLINPDQKKGRINKEIYGHFAEHLGRGIYEGIFVKPESGIRNEDGMRTDVVDALKEIRVPVIRWPGGCFADEYHWQDGIGPRANRKKMINTNWGGVLEDNSFGTDEFFRLCEMLGCEAYVNGNLGSGSVREMQEWMEYITFDGVSPMSDTRRANGHEDPFRMKFFAVGNESWGCGGNMLPEYYADEFRKYQSFLHDSQKDKALKIAVGPSGDDYEWTETLLQRCMRHSPKDLHGFMDGLSMHYYMFLRGFNDKGSATEFTEDEWNLTMKRSWFMEELVQKNAAIMDRYDPDKKIGLVVDEWGNWFDVEPGSNPGFLYQQNTMRDAVTAAMNLNIFNNHCDRVTMANIAQMINVLQAVILTEGADMVKTPTYHVFRMFRDHQDADLVESSFTGVQDISGCPALTQSSSVSENGQINVTISNQSYDQDEVVKVQLSDETGKYHTCRGEILEGVKIAEDPFGHHSCNTFAEKELVLPRALDALALENGQIQVSVPAGSVLHLTFEG